MSNVTSLFNYADLAFAAYANLKVGDTALPANIDALAGPTGAGMSLTQATQFAARFPTVVASFDDRNSGGSGFQVTVFKDTAGNLTVAFRGTTIPEDLPIGADIVGSGAAYDQIVAIGTGIGQV